MPLLVALAAAAALHSFDVPKTLGQKRIDKAKATTGMAVLLPQTIQTEFKRVYPNALPAGKDQWGLIIGAAKNCTGASVCGIANFYGFRGSTASGGKKVLLAKGRIGHFHKSTCGANCSFPSIEWNERGAEYAIEAKEASGLKAMKALANSAIKHGPR